MKKNFTFLKYRYMLKRYFGLFIFSAFISCNNSQEKSDEITNAESPLSSISLINEEGKTVETRFSPPENYTWVKEKPNSFGAFLLHFPLEKNGAQILKYNNTPIATQDLHDAVYKIDVGEKDLQQCADSVIRLYAEFLWKENRKDEIAFHFTSGDLVKWSDYREGYRVFVAGDSVSFKKTEGFDDSYQYFKKYLELIYNYAGTISLTKETKSVTKTQDLKTGDILIVPGSPGHVVFIAGICENKEGEKLFLLSEGFTPAQSIHLLKNPFNKEISPWYELEVNSSKINTARFTFSPVNFRSLD
jgi:hypothetical protein